MSLNAARIRSATPQDAEALTELLLELEFPGFAELTRTEVFGQVRQKLTAAQASSYTLLIAESSRSIVGYAAVHWLPTLFQPGPDGYLSELFVATSARSQSVGTRLLHTVYDEARQRGCKRLTLINRRDRDSYRRGFYRKQGWVEQPEAARFVYELEG